MFERIILVGGIAATVAIGAFVITRDYRRLTNQVYALMTLAMLVLLVANSMTTVDNPMPLFFIRIVIAATSITIASLYVLIRLVIDDSSRTSRSLVIKIVPIVTGLVILLDLSPVVFSGIQVKDGQLVPTTSFGALFFLLHFIVLLALGIISLLRAILHDRSKKASQYWSFLYAIIPLLVLAPITSFIVPVIFHYSALTAFTPVYAVYLVGVIAYAMVRHGLFDIKRTAVRTSVYVLVLATLAVVYYGVLFIASKILLGDAAPGAGDVSPINLVVALGLAFLFQPVKTFFDRVTNNIFYRDSYNPETFFGLLSNVLSTTTDLKSLLERASEVVSMTLKSEQAFFYIRNGTKKYTVAGTKGHTQLLMSEAAHFDDYVIRTSNRIIVTDSIANRHGMYAVLKHRGIAILLPLLHDGGVIGYLAIGDSLGERYNARDLRILETIADELVIAIQNAEAVEEVREVNATLQQRIDGATRDLRSKNERLKQLDNTKDEFISMASHQLRTPLTSVKGYVSMILDGDAGPITEQQRRFLTEAFDSSTRMAGIIGDFLNVSRLQTGKFMLEKSEVNLADIAESEIEHLKNTAAMRGLTLQYKKPKHFPAVFADKSKIEQVMMNFMDNALFYAPDTKNVEVGLTHDGGKAIFTVRDHGIGVPKAEQKGLFTKFFRATNARKQRPDGTGVGIFLAKKVVTAHHGEIIFESEEGKGSTFGFTLPLLKRD